jgi:hypothetical protein
MISKLTHDAYNHGTGFAGDPRNPVLSEDDLKDLAFANRSGYATVAEYHAAIKSKFAQERREREADAETDVLLEGVRDLIGHKALCDKLHDDISELESGAARMKRHKGALA